MKNRVLLAVCLGLPATAAHAQKLQPSTGVTEVIQTDGAGNVCTNGAALPCPQGGGGGGGGAITAASGAYAAGSISAGAYVAGSLLAGALADGADTTEGTKADAACASTSGSCTGIALWKLIANNTGGAVPAQSSHGVLIGAVEGPVASGSATGTYPVAIGGRAQNAEPTAVSNGNVVEQAHDLVGRSIVFPFANKENLVEGAVTVTGTSSTSLIGVPGSGLYIYLTAVSCFNSGSTGTTVVFQNGSAGTTIYEGYVAASGGGFTQNFPSPIGGVNSMTANTALYFQAGSATTSLYCNASGFKGT